jgi:hypothetical protein
MDALQASDPIPTDLRKLGHLYVTVRPVSSAEDALVNFLNSAEPEQKVRSILGNIMQHRGGGAVFDPDLRSLTFARPCADGFELTSYQPDEAEPWEPGLLRLTLSEDGTVALVCGRGTDRYAFGRHPVDATDDSDRRGVPVVIPALALGLVYSTLALAGAIAHEVSGYEGRWQAGVRIGGMSGAYALDFAQVVHDRDRRAPYRPDIYERATTASQIEMLDTPETVTKRLMSSLLRSLGVASRYLPYKPSL